LGGDDSDREENSGRGRPSACDDYIAAHDKQAEKRGNRVQSGSRLNTMYEAIDLVTLLWSPPESGHREELSSTQEQDWSRSKS